MDSCNAMPNGTMDTDLTAVKAALAEISDTELAALIAATYPHPACWRGSTARATGK